MGPGAGRPLAEARQRGVVAVPPIATDGVHAATAWPGKQVIIHIPNERELTAANWGEGGAAAYGSGPVDYVVIPDAGGGADIPHGPQILHFSERFFVGDQISGGHTSAPGGSGGGRQSSSSSSRARPSGWGRCIHAGSTLNT